MITVENFDVAQQSAKGSFDTDRLTAALSRKVSGATLPSVHVIPVAQDDSEEDDDGRTSVDAASTHGSLTSVD
jgi:hypothetical protein